MKLEAIHRVVVRRLVPLVLTTCIVCVAVSACDGSDRSPKYPTKPGRFVPMPSASEMAAPRILDTATGSIWMARRTKDGHWQMELWTGALPR